MSSQFPYQRLPGKLIGIVRKASLWEGKDHLLCISGTRFVENYRRFFYRDIQAIVLRRCTRFGSIGAWLLTAVGLSWCLIWLRIPGVHAAAKTAVGILTTVSVYRLVVALGFSCRCFIQTAVSREELPSMMRTWNVKHALERIRAHIHEEQGTLPAVFSLPASGSAGEVATPAPEPIFSGPGVRRATAPHSLAVNLALAGFLCCLIDAGASIYFFAGPTPALASTPIRLFNAVLTPLQGGTILIALIQIHKLRLLRSLRNLLVAALCFTGLEIYVASFLSTLSSTRNGVTTIRADMLSVWHTVVRADAGVALVIGIAGLLVILVNWENFRRGGLSAA